MTDFDRIRAAVEAATPGEWRAVAFDVVDGYADKGGVYSGTMPLILTTAGASVADLVLMAGARQWVPQLLDAVAERDGEIARLQHDRSHPFGGIEGCQTCSEVTP